MQVQASGVFELHLQSFRNDKGLNEDGNCCNGYRSEGTCTSPCKTFFRVCLTHYQTVIASDPDLHPTCTFGDYTTPVVADNSVNFSARTDLPMDNPLRFPISEFSWPVSLTSYVASSSHLPIIIIIISCGGVVCAFFWSPVCVVCVVSCRLHPDPPLLHQPPSPPSSPISFGGVGGVQYVTSTVCLKLSTCAH